MNFTTTGWEKKLKTGYKKKQYYERKTDRPYRDLSVVHFQQIRMERVLNCSKARAKTRGIPWDLKYEDLVFPTHCPYLGTEITHIVEEGRQQTNASLDRIDSSKGYTADNVEIISDLANRMKQEATKEQLIAFAKGILLKYT